MSTDDEDESILKTCFGSRNLGSICLGARKSRQTTKISAETLLENTRRQLHGGTQGRTRLPRRGWFGCLDLGKQLTEHPNQVVVVGTPENLRNEGSALDQKLDCKFQAHKHELGLAVGVLNPSSTDIGSTVMQHDVSLPILEFPSKQVPALRSRDIGSEGDNTRDGLDGNQVNTFDCM